MNCSSVANYLTRWDRFIASDGSEVCAVNVCTGSLGSSAL